MKKGINKHWRDQWEVLYSGKTIKLGGELEVVRGWEDNVSWCVFLCSWFLKVSNLVYYDFRYKLSVEYYYIAYNYILIVLVSNANGGWKFTCCRLTFCLWIYVNACRLICWLLIQTNYFRLKCRCDHTSGTVEQFHFHTIPSSNLLCSTI